MNRPELKHTTFDNFAGVAQVTGVLGEYTWFFHARSGSWRFHLVESNTRLATAANPDSDDYWLDGSYPTDRHLTNEQVSSLVDDCIDRYWIDRGQKSYYQNVPSDFDST